MLKRIALSIVVVGMFSISVFGELVKVSVIDKIEITRYGNIQVRRADIIIEDGKEIAKTSHRHVLSPGDDTTKETDRVKAVAQAVWTPAVIVEHKARIKKALEELTK